MYYVYMLRCDGNLIYTGITTNLKRRMKEHFSKHNCAKFTMSHSAKKLEASWIFPDRSSASSVEIKIKKLSKSKKEQLILGNYPAHIFPVINGKLLSEIVSKEIIEQINSSLSN